MIAETSFILTLSGNRTLVCRWTAHPLIDLSQRIHMNVSVFCNWTTYVKTERFFPFCFSFSFLFRSEPLSLLVSCLCRIRNFDFNSFVIYSKISKDSFGNFEIRLCFVKRRGSHSFGISVTSAKYISQVPYARPRFPRNVNVFYASQTYRQNRFAHDKLSVIECAAIDQKFIIQRKPLRNVLLISWTGMLWARFGHEMDIKKHNERDDLNFFGERNLCTEINFCFVNR